MAGEILARAIVDGEDTWRLFSPFELVWAGGKLGRAVKQVYYWWFRAQERYEARQAREREAEVERTNGREPAWNEHREAGIEPEIVPAADMPAEPMPASLPADPVQTANAGDGRRRKRAEAAARCRLGAPRDPSRWWRISTRPGRRGNRRRNSPARRPPPRANRDHLPRAPRLRQDD